VGVLGVAALAQHGATFLMFRIDGPPAERSRHAVARLWPAVLVLYVLVTVSTLRVRPAAIEHSPLVAVLPVIALAALIALRAAVARGRAVLAFQTSCVFIASLLVAAAATLYPYLLPAYPASAGGLSIFAASPSSIALATALSFTIFGVIVVAIYSLAIARRMREKVVVE
ncbi:MAG: cytochrome d ubiquinol oxidase subunit II, partial [Vulcanimicrobiaceae bacterium]